MKATRTLALVIAVLMLGLSVVGCSTSSGSEPASGATSGDTSGSAASGESSGAASGESKSDIVIVATEDMATFDTTESSAMATQFIMRAIYLHLFQVNENNEYVPWLCKDYEASDDAYVINIHEGVQYEDGTEVTADDVVYCLNRALGNPTLSLLLASVESVEKTGDYQITLHMSGPSPSLPLALYHPGCAILPASYVEENDASQDWSDPICSGPYKVKERSLGSYVILEKNDNYFFTEDAAQNETLTVRCVPEASSRTIMVETGEADVNKDFTTADYARATSNPDVKLHVANSTTINYWSFDCTLEPFDDKLVRQAMQWGINRDDVIAIAAEGLGTPLYSVLAPDCMYYVDNPAGYSYDPDKARELLAQAGYPEGFTTQISAYNDIGAKTAEIIQVCIADLGVNAEIMRYETTVRTEMQQNHESITQIARWGCYTDPDLVLPRLHSKTAAEQGNGVYFWTDRLEELWVAGRTYDDATRAEVYKEAQEILADESDWIPLYVGESYALTRADLQGVVVGTDGIILPHRLHY